jgi:hypothetical protein
MPDKRANRASENPDSPEVGFGEITIDLLKARFWIVSGFADNPGVNTPFPTNVYDLVEILREWPGLATEVTCSRQA